MDKGSLVTPQRLALAGFRYVPRVPSAGDADPGNELGVGQLLCGEGEKGGEGGEGGRNVGGRNVGDDSVGGRQDDRTVLEYTGQYFGDWEPGDDPILVAIHALESAYAESALNSRADVAEQIAFLHRQLGRTQEVNAWRMRAAVDARARSAPPKTKAGKRDAPQNPVPTGTADSLPRAADEGSAAAGARQGSQELRQGGQELPLAGKHHVHASVGGALVVPRGHVSLAGAPQTHNGAPKRVAPDASAAVTWKQRAKDLSALRHGASGAAGPMPLALTPPPRWAQYVNASQPPVDEVQPSCVASAVKSSVHRERKRDASATVAPRKDAAAQLARVSDVRVRGQTGYLSIDPPPPPATRAGAAAQQASRSGGGGGVVVPLPSKGGALFDLRSRATGQTLEGVTFSEGGRVITRTDSKDPPVVTWASSLLTGASPGVEVRGAAHAGGGGCWALQVTKQTGRWMVGFAKAPLSEDYGLVLDMVSDGCVVGNFGAVYRTQSEALVNEALAAEELTYEDIPKLHRRSITTECERQAGCVPWEVSSVDQGGALAFGTDSIILLELHVSNSTGGGGRGGASVDRTATAKFHLLQAQLLASSKAGGRVFTGAAGDECVPSGKLRAIRSFSVPGVPADAVPFVNMENSGDSAALLNAKQCRREIRWLVEPMCRQGQRKLQSKPAAADDLRKCILDGVRERKSRQLKIGDRRGRVITGMTGSVLPATLPSVSTCFLPCSPLIPSLSPPTTPVVGGAYSCLLAA